MTSPPGTVCHQWFQRLLAERQVSAVWRRSADISPAIKAVVSELAKAPPVSMASRAALW